MDQTRRTSSNESQGSNGSSRDSKSYFIRTTIPFLLLQFSVGLCASLQATFYPIEATLKGATASQFGAVFGIIHLSLFMFGEEIIVSLTQYQHCLVPQVHLLANISQYGESRQSSQQVSSLTAGPSSCSGCCSGSPTPPPSSSSPTSSDSWRLHLLSWDI